MESTLNNVKLFDKLLASLYLLHFAFIGGSIDAVDQTRQDNLANCRL